MPNACAIKNIYIRQNDFAPQPHYEARRIAVSTVDTSALELAKGDRFYLQVPGAMFSCTMGIVDQKNNLCLVKIIFVCTSTMIRHIVYQAVFSVINGVMVVTIGAGGC